MLALADCILTCDDVSIPVSLPMAEGTRPEGRQRVLLGLSASGAALAREVLHREALLRAKSGVQLARVRLLDVHPTLAVATAEISPLHGEVDPEPEPPRAA